MRCPDPVYRRPVSGVKTISGAISCRVLIAALCCVVGAVFVQSAQASTLEAINHTHWAINRFSVDGQSGIDIIGAYQGGGGGCCYIAPLRWLPGMTVRVDWETGVAGSKGFPGFADRAKYDAWLGRMETQKRQHSKVVPVPDYTGQKVCGLTVHFLPCDNVQVTTSCYAFGSPEYPIKTPLHLPEPQSCPK
ncbi:DUF3304 domain-containing protein [Pseudomonas syringae pv. actinidiae]|uniref:DUF3304 domain-containing protein n=1 Tax=Pseudomonas syringae TaxID=317 RepID=UPI0012684F68|nr:DUF3304 domain-containing protein [Pseudomonas syringae]MBL3606153.1 DUF3304 domain-containing protein [Pseudomonas syringae pv. actinidiae]MBL3624067.1 DUF3304 domain-containing protein [Pseudomonas syringae pv. actinidiae]MBL3635477.1 DUF3304 domain-containing protein [Pseudomonas syringae pv. actinidiae]MBL3663902.1 DUF3304 domain-containing protein [Pseudomonas syringae pv. actinidiae]MCQ4653742.1 DUF3304 domain-containing protein [Pseudomonas syringae]